jgi:hypothetical protein
MTTSTEKAQDPRGVLRIRGALDAHHALIRAGARMVTVLVGGAIVLGLVFEADAIRALGAAAIAMLVDARVGATLDGWMPSLTLGDALIWRGGTATITIDDGVGLGWRWTRQPVGTRRWLWDLHLTTRAGDRHRISFITRHDALSTPWIDVESLEPALGPSSAWRNDTPPPPLAVRHTDHDALGSVEAWLRRLTGTDPACAAPDAIVGAGEVWYIDGDVLTDATGRSCRAADLAWGQDAAAASPTAVAGWPDGPAFYFEAPFAAGLAPIDPPVDASPIDRLDAAALLAWLARFRPELVPWWSNAVDHETA